MLKYESKVMMIKKIKFRNFCQKKFVPVFMEQKKIIFLKKFPKSWKEIFYGKPVNVFYYLGINLWFIRMIDWLFF